MVTKKKSNSFTYTLNNSKISIPFAIKANKILFQVLTRLSIGLSIRLATYLFLHPRKTVFNKYDLEKIKEADEYILRIEDKKIVVSVWGEGRPILLIHGWEGKRTSFKHFVDPLVNQGYQVFAVDAPAHGHSSGRDTDLPEVVRVIQYVNEVYGPFYAIVAHSFGGLATLLSFCENVSVEKLVLISSLASPFTALASFQQVLKLPDQVVRGIQTQIEKRVNRPFESFVPSCLQKSSSTKTLVIHDKRDLIVPYSEASNLKSLIPTAEVITTEGLGHHHILRAPEVITLVESFLNKY